MTKTAQEKKYNRWIWILSITIPLAVAVLFGVRIPGVDRLGFLPPIYASINGLTSILLIVAFLQIKKGKVEVHKKIMQVCIVLSVLFLVMYVAYHMTSDSTSYGGEGVIKYVYFFILVTHILLSIGVIPFVLVTYVRALLGNYEKHKRIAKITFLSGFM